MLGREGWTGSLQKSQYNSYSSPYNSFPHFLLGTGEIVLESLRLVILALGNLDFYTGPERGSCSSYYPLSRALVQVPCCLEGVQFSNPESEGWRMFAPRGRVRGLGAFAVTRERQGFDTSLDWSPVTPWRAYSPQR